MHPNGGGILFTDPGYGSHWYYEGTVRELELPTSVYHIDAQSGRLTKLTDEIKKPNGLCFSPDYRTLYVADTAPTHFPGEKAKIIAWTVQDNGSRSPTGASSPPWTRGFHDGIRADVDGNIWCGTGFGGEGVDGVHVYAPDGTRIGPDRDARGHSQPVLRRQESKPAVHDEQPVGLHALHGPPLL